LRLQEGLVKCEPFSLPPSNTVRYVLLYYERTELSLLLTGFPGVTRG